ncbi:hypothetical protein N7519_002184 [Penicillium mononematosum]|uniref:uncharacterized protein n=1 Tax=Penicillium mononematosum TaxID=268346 RepID=UPI002549B1B4|nr:uncharacterized protein N7519_002184 [Penicillium mononematosum]KAJ6187276.1 hypothetical protein N7519_002184 [Penicillium mononematosum]
MLLLAQDSKKNSRGSLPMLTFGSSTISNEEFVGLAVNRGTRANASAMGIESAALTVTLMVLAFWGISTEVAVGTYSRVPAVKLQVEKLPRLSTTPAHL